MTLIAISKQAGVSKATVSRVMHNNPSVSAEIAARVRRVVAEHGYEARPRQKRRQPAERKLLNKSIALLFPDPSAVAMKTVLSGRLSFGIHQALVEQRANLVVCSLQDWDRLPASIVDKTVDAVIVRGTVPLAAFIDQIRPLPCVTVFETFGRPSLGDQVIDDSAMVGELACDFLAEQGCRSMMVIGRDPLHPAYGARADAFMRCANFRGLDVDSVLCSMAFTELVAKVLSRQPPAQGLFVAGNDEDVAGICSALAAAGVAVGRDMKMICTAYYPAYIKSIEPSLDYIDIEPEAIGRAAVEMLLWRLENPTAPMQRRLVQPRLVRSGAH